MVENESGVLVGTVAHVHSIRKDEEAGLLASEETGGLVARAKIKIGE